MIQVNNLVKRYGKQLAVDHLSFSVSKGQIYGFLGPNGAGKTTTMNIMTGYIAASEGSVTICGHDILTEPEEAKKCIGYLPEMPPLYPDMTVWEYLLFVSELKKVPKDKRGEQLEQILSMTKIEDVQGRLIKNLSKGYKQRVGLAQAIVGFPEVIILDEPMVGLDPAQIIETRALIQELAKQHTILLSSHILSEISTLCDHILIINKGQLVASDTPEGLQHLMSKTTEIDITVQGSKDNVERLLAGISHIDSYDMQAGPDAGSIFVRLTTPGDVDLRSEISLACGQAGLPLLSMNRVEKSLEDIFLQLTGEASADSDTETSEESLKKESTENTTEEISEDAEQESAKGGQKK